MATVIQYTIRDALRKVVDPEVGMDVVAMGMIRQVEIEEKGKVDPPEVIDQLTIQVVAPVVVHRQQRSELAVEEHRPGR